MSIYLESVSYCHIEAPVAGSGISEPIALAFSILRALKYISTEKRRVASEGCAWCPVH